MIAEISVKRTRFRTKGWLGNEEVLINNPANPMKKIVVWFCAMHQLKNMCNALLRCDNSNNHHFVKNGVTMTWNVVVDTFK